MNILKYIRAFWVVFRGGERWQSILSQSDFWYDRCQIEFKSAIEAYERDDMEEFEKAKQHHELCHSRFKKERRVLIDP